MIHEETYYTCDRCGTRIDYSDLYGYKLFPKRREVPVSATINYQVRKGYIADQNLSIPETQAVVIEYYDRHIRDIHLCGECAKEFKKWLEEEKKND